jgi:hypothetical protein
MKQSQNHHYGVHQYRNNNNTPIIITTIPVIIISNTRTNISRTRQYGQYHRCAEISSIVIRTQQMHHRIISHRTIATTYQNNGQQRREIPNNTANNKCLSAVKQSNAQYCRFAIEYRNRK